MLVTKSQPTERDSESRLVICSLFFDVSTGVYQVLTNNLTAVLNATRLRECGLPLVGSNGQA